MLQLIKPRYFMPIHGEFKMLMQHRQTAIDTGMDPNKIFVCANGDILILRNHEVLQSDWRYQGDDIYVDGNDITGLSTAVLKDRRILADNGLVAVVIAIDSKENKILSRPIIVSRGFVFIKDSQSLIKEAEFIVNASLQEKMKEKTTFSEIKNCIRSTLEPFLYKKTKRNPIVIPVILNSKQTMEELTKKRTAHARSKRPIHTKKSILKEKKNNSSLFYDKIWCMTKLQKILFVIVACLSVCMMTICFSLYRAIYVDPNEVVIQYKMIKDKKIPDEMKDVSIAYFTDLEYGAFENKGRVDRLFKKLNDLHADIFIFGGDLLAENYTVSEEAKADMIARLSAIDAPLGKFAVLGEQDLINEERLQQVNDIYHQAQFEVLNNTNRLITNRSFARDRADRIVSDPNMEQALTGIGDQTYNLLVSHYADPF